MNVKKAEDMLEVKRVALNELMKSVRRMRSCAIRNLRIFKKRKKTTNPKR